MSPAMLVSMAAGSAFMAGLVCLAAGVRGRPMATAVSHAPPSRWVRLKTSAAQPRLRRRVLVALAAGLLVFALSRWVVAGVAAAAATAILPRLLSGRPAEARIAQLEALEQWTRKMADTLGASRGLEQALHYSIRSCPAPLEEPVRLLATRLAVARLPTGEALRLFADDLDDPVADAVVGALLLAADVRGPGLHAVLTAAADNVARGVAARREAEAERAKHRAAMRWIAIIVIGSTAWLTLLQRQYFSIYSTTVGQLVLAAVSGVFAAGLWWMARLGRVRVEHRFLTDETDHSERRDGRR
ncbi:hypothetical protein OHA25_60310 (plasmid) [Nonomuraea sp. NBC_00507]|uniref:type II secretion system F family protein n=1 Tax=Nonomuraea sp. NBC_00507 TaxID=2976002 RepID=UPI002E185F78